MLMRALNVGYAFHYSSYRSTHKLKTRYSSILGNAHDRLRDLIVDVGVYGRKLQSLKTLIGK